jgi:hypothetical protein
MDTTLASIRDDQLPKLISLDNDRLERKMSVAAFKRQTSLPSVNSVTTDLPDDMPIDTQIAFLRASKASLYARVLVIVAWLLLAIVVTKEISNWDSLTNVSSLIVLVAGLAAPTVTYLLFKGKPYQPIGVSEVSLPWLRDTKFMEVASRNYRSMPGGVILEFNPCFLSTVMLWFIVMMKIWHHIPTF